MKNTTADWVSLIRYRLQCEKDGYPTNYLSIVIKTMNDVCIDPLNPITFMDNVAHVLTTQFLDTLTVNAIQKLFAEEAFAGEIKTFLERTAPLALQYTEDYRINYQQYQVFKRLLSFEAIQNVANVDKKRFILTLKRSKNNEDVV